MNKIDTIKNQTGIFLKLKMIGELFGKELDESLIQIFLENLLGGQFSLLGEDFNIFFPDNKPPRQRSLSLSIRLAIIALKQGKDTLNTDQFEQFINIVKNCLKTEDGESDLLKNEGFLLDYYEVFCSGEHKEVEHLRPQWLEEQHLKETVKNQYKKSLCAR